MFSVRQAALLIFLLTIMALGLSLFATSAIAHCDGVKHGPGHQHCEGGASTTIVVTATGATPADNCALLQDALGGITDASADRPYLVKIDAGVFACGNVPIILPPFVALEGSGRFGTKLEFAFIEGAGCVNAKTCLGGVQMADHTALRELSVKNDGVGAGSNVTGVTVAANSINVEINDANIFATNGTHAVLGLMIYDDSSVEVHNAHISAIGVNAINFTTGAASNGDNINTAYHASNIFADGAGSNATYGVVGANFLTPAPGTTALIDSSSVVAVNGVTVGAGVLVQNGSTMRIRGSSIEGSDQALRNKSASTILVSFSELSGAKFNEGGLGTFQCFSVHDESYVALSGTCD